MNAIELNVNITSDHELRVRLPDHAPPGPARVIVLFDSQATPPARGNLDDFLAQLPINAAGGLTHAQSVERVAEERAAWGEA